MSTYHLQIVTPDGQFFDGNAERLIVRAIDGEVCIMPRHAAYISALATGEARVTIEGKVRRAACSGGMITVTGDDVRLVATTFEWKEDINAERALLAKEKAEEILKNAKDDREVEMAKAKLSRALNRMKVSE